MKERETKKLQNLVPTACSLHAATVLDGVDATKLMVLRAGGIITFEPSLTIVQPDRAL